MHGKILILLSACLSCLAVARADDADRLGVMTHFAQNWDVALIPRIAEGGITHVRDELYWEVVEPRRGEYVFPASYDAYMEALRRRGIRPLIALTFANPNYDGGQTPYSDEAAAAYARYAVEVLRHYGSQIAAVEIWNEYNGSFAKGPVTADRAAYYLRMLKAAYVAIKRERPDVVVVGASTSGLPMPYLERLFEGGGLDYMDAVSVHPYRTASTPEGLEAQMAKLQELIARYNADGPKPVWVTEIGWGTRVSQAEGDLAIDEGTQAKFLVRAFVLLLSARVERAYWYLFRDYNQFATMGLVRAGKDAQAKPAYLAMAALAERLRGASLGARVPSATDVYAFALVRGDGVPAHVLWALEPRALRVPAGAVVRDLFGQRLSGEELLLTDSPVYIEGALPALPPPPEGGSPEPTLAEAVSGFSDEQGRNGWSYGAFVGDSLSFLPLTKYQVTDWKEEWVGVYPYISISANEQHPSSNGGRPVSAVRRWRSETSGVVRAEGYFKCGLQGDGVRVRVLAGQRVLMAETLGGGRPIIKRFSVETRVEAGDTIDFAVDSGAAGRTDFDATEVVIAIRKISGP